MLRQLVGNLFFILFCREDNNIWYSILTVRTFCLKYHNQIEQMYKTELADVKKFVELKSVFMVNICSMQKPSKHFMSSISLSFTHSLTFCRSHTQSWLPRYHKDIVCQHKTYKWVIKTSSKDCHSAAKLIYERKQHNNKMINKFFFSFLLFLLYMCAIVTNSNSASIKKEKTKPLNRIVIQQILKSIVNYRSNQVAAIRIFICHFFIAFVCYFWMHFVNSLHRNSILSLASF